MKNKYLIILISFLAATNFAVAQTVYFNGLGRALVTSDASKGSLYDTTSAVGARSHADTASPKRGVGGYTIFDLGVNAQPNESLRASAIFRIKNVLGGFYGDGSYFYFRQLRLDGIISKVVKYEIGDIDLGLTPYTLYNFDESYHDYESDVFAIRRSVVHYENFNFGNKWRLQGAHAQAALKFNKVIEKINVRAFATRPRPTNYLNIPDRIFAGGRIDAVQSKYFQVGANLTRMADLPQTSPVTQGNMYNSVVTGDYKLNLPIGDKGGAELYGEFGKSYYNFDTVSTATGIAGEKFTTTKKGGFYDLGLALKHDTLDIKFFVNYRYVGADYLSPGAQTRRIYDYGTGQYQGASGSFVNYSNLTQLYPTYNNGTFMRAPGLYDRFTQENMRNLTLQPQLMAFLPQYNNITPYGVATPDRKGFTFGFTAGSSEKLIKADLIIDKLSEITGQGTDQLRKFTGIKGGMSLNIAKLLKTDRLITLSGGARYEHTTRQAGQSIVDTTAGVGIAPIDLKSTLVDLGLVIEIVKNFDIIAGYKSLYAKGNEVIAVRDASNTIVRYISEGTAQSPGTSSYNIFNFNPGFNVKQSIYAFGIRYRFTKNTYFTAQGNFVNYFDDSQSYQDYKIKQLFLNYTMIF